MELPLTYTTMDALVFQLLILVLTAKGLEIHTPTRTILEKAVGQNVKLDCHFTTSPEDAGQLEIEWSVKSIRHPMETAEVLMYTAGQIYDQYYEPLKGRVYFHSQDPEKGDASIHLLQLTPEDTGIYKCQVKKVPGIQNIKTVLRVLKPPSEPRCYYTEGTEELGKTTVLHCKSQEGAAPIWYTWARIPPWKLPNSVVIDQTAGTLTIQDASDSAAGTYKCTAVNRVGMEVCFLELNIQPPPSVGMIVAAVMGTLTAIVIIASITYCIKQCLCQPQESETSNEIVMDASPPKRRKTSLAKWKTSDNLRVTMSEVTSL